MLDGVAFALMDCLAALTSAGTKVERVTAVGGGSRSRVWLEIIATVLGVTVDLPQDGDFGAALGAARLGQAAADGYSDALFSAPPMAAAIDPNPALRSAYGEAYARWRKLYPAVKEI